MVRAALKKYAMESRPLVSRGMKYVLSESAERRNFVLDKLSGFVDLWVFALGVMAFVNLIAVYEFPTLMWAILWTVNTFLSLGINAWFLGVLKYLARRDGESTFTKINQSGAFYRTLLRATSDFVVLLLIWFIYEYTREMHSTIAAMPANGLWTFTNSMYSLFLILAIVAGFARGALIFATGFSA